MTDSCETCMFSRPLEAALLAGPPSLQCQFFPPQVNILVAATPLGQTQLQHIPSWPTVAKTSWCGQHAKAVGDGGPAVHRTGVSRL